MSLYVIKNIQYSMLIVKKNTNNNYRYRILHFRIQRKYQLKLMFFSAIN